MFNIGEKVVHPLHGAGIIEGIENKKIFNKNKQFYIMCLPDSTLEKLFIPVENADNIGVRNLVNTDSFDEIEEYLKAQYILEINEVWKKQFKNQEGKVNSGNLMSVAEAMKFLYYKSLKKKLGSMDKWLLGKAQDILASEMHFVKDLNFTEAKNRILAWLTKSLAT